MLEETLFISGEEFSKKTEFYTSMMEDILIKAKEGVGIDISEEEYEVLETTVKEMYKSLIRKTYNDTL